MRAITYRGYSPTITFEDGDRWRQYENVTVASMIRLANYLNTHGAKVVFWRKGWTATVDQPAPINTSTISAHDAAIMALVMYAKADVRREYLGTEMVYNLCNVLIGLLRIKADDQFDAKNVLDEAIAVIEERKKKGIETYGVPLSPNNGRDDLQDCIEEVADALAYWTNYMLGRAMK